MRKIFRTILGFAVLIVGVILAIPGVPGPGFAFILLGLVILSDHFDWAKRAVTWLRNKAEKAKEKAQALRSNSKSQTDL